MLATPKPLVADWEFVRNKIRTEAWAAELEKKIREQTEQFIANYHDDPDRAAGWGHNYFCRNCLSNLTFDPMSPKEHKCGVCGKINSGVPEIDEAWNGSYRSAACGRVFEAAVLYCLDGGGEHYIDFMRKVLDFFSENFGKIEAKVHHPYKGAFVGMNLSDAIGTNYLLMGMGLVRDKFTEEELERWKTKLFYPAAAFFCTAPSGTPNIMCWMRGAAGMIGLFFGDRRWCERAAEGEDGIKAWLAKGLLPEGFWYESSFHYHLYAAEALTYYNAYCELYDYDFPELRNGLYQMYKYPLRFAFPDGTFPSPNDGWPNRSFRSYTHQYEWVRRTYEDEPAFRCALAHAYTIPGEPGEGEPGGLARLLFGRDWVAEWNAESDAVRNAVWRMEESTHDPDIYYAMLRNRNASVFFKYGHKVRGHSHADIMNFELFAHGGYLSRDISNSGYNSDLFRDWQRRSIAHNTVMVDMLTQPHRPQGRIVSFDAETNAVVGAADEVYDGVSFTRALRLEDDRLLDEFTVEASDGATHTFDWFFHASGELEHDVAGLVSVPAPGDAEGYQLMKDVVRAELNGDIVLRWKQPERTLTLTVKGAPGTEVYLFRGCEHREDLLRWGVMVRRNGERAVFEAEYAFAAD